MFVYEFLIINTFHLYYYSSANDLFHKICAQLVIEIPWIDRFFYWMVYVYRVRLSEKTKLKIFENL
jgi:hypothetical protein